MRISDWSSDVCSSDLAGHAECIAAPRSGRVRQALERLNEAHRRDKIEQRNQIGRNHAWPPGLGFLSFFLNISSMRRVTRKPRSEEHTSELQSLMRNSYAVFCLKKKN